MPIGYPVNVGTINNGAGDLACRLRDWAIDVEKFWKPITALGTDDTSRIAALVTLGFSDTDAAAMHHAVDILNTVAQIYYGNAAQPSPYNFDSDLAALWGAR
jgi:hypothetical protein